MDRDCQECKERLAKLHSDPTFHHMNPYHIRQRTGRIFSSSVCEMCTNYYPDEQEEKTPEPVYQMKYKVIRFVNPSQEKINAQQNFKIAQVESHLKEHLVKEGKDDSY